MKKLLYLGSVFMVCLVASLLFAHGMAGHGALCAAFIPMVPRNMFRAGRHSLERAIDLGDGTWGPGGESLHAPFYDRMKFSNALALATRTLFKTAVGQQREGATLTYADTNIEKSESVPTSQKWTFWALKLYYMATGARTDVQIQGLLDFFRTTTIRCILNSKDDMFRLPLWRFFGATQVISAPAVTVNSRFPQGTFMGSFSLNIPIVLQSLTDWELRIEPLVASAAALDGDFLGFEWDCRKDRKN